MQKNRGQFVKGSKRQKRLARLGAKAFWKRMTPEERSAYATRRNLIGWAKLSEEERHQRTRYLGKMWEGTTPEKRVQMQKARMKKVGKKRRSERIAKGWANSTSEQKALRAIRMRVTKAQRGVERLEQTISHLKEEIRIARVRTTPEREIIKRYNSLLRIIEKRRAHLIQLVQQKSVLEKAAQKQK